MDVRRRDIPYWVSIENAIDGMHVVDADGNVVAVNQAFCDMLGYAREELLGMNVRDWDAQWSAVELEHKIEEVLQQREVFETRHRRKDGSLLEVEVAVAAAPVDGETLLFASARDISARKQAEAHLRESEERFRCLVDQSIAGLYILQDGRLAYANARFAEIFGYAGETDVVGQSCEHFIAPADREAVKTRVERRLAGASRQERFTFRGQRRDGAQIDVGVDGTVGAYRGRPAIVGLMQDISERQESERRIAQYIARLESALHGTVRVASAMSAMRDPYTAGHERRVGEIAAAIGAELGFDALRVEGLRVMGLLHDIGKMAVPAEILSKPGRLSEAEFALIQQHPERGHEILSEVEFPWPLARAVLEHHERVDGTGYPQGLEGDAILLEARILAVADTLAAMSAHRPYRAAHSVERALEELEAQRGTRLDAAAVDACLRLFREQGWQLPD